MAKKSVYFSVDHAPDKQEKKQIKQEIGHLPGILSVSVNAQRGSVAVDYDTTGNDPVTIKNTIDGIGFQSTLIASETHIM